LVQIQAVKELELGHTDLSHSRRRIVIAYQ
jgi:hypothetical protein